MSIMASLTLKLKEREPRSSTNSLEEKLGPLVCSQTTSLLTLSMQDIPSSVSTVALLIWIPGGTTFLDSGTTQKISLIQTGPSTTTVPLSQILFKNDMIKL